MHSKINAKGQVTIPKPIRDALGIGPNDRVAFIREGGRVLLQPLQTLKAFRGAVKAKSPGSFDEERSRAKAAVADVYSLNRKHPSRLDGLLAGVDSDNLHQEVDLGPAIGKETW